MSASDWHARTIYAPGDRILAGRLLGGRDIVLSCWTLSVYPTSLGSFESQSRLSLQNARIRVSNDTVGA